MAKLIDFIARETVYKNTIVQCEMEGCGRLLYPAMTYVVVEGEAVGEGQKKICEACFDKIGWEHPDVQR